MGDVEIEDDDEEPTLRPVGANASSPHKNGGNLYENSDDDDEEDALGMIIVMMMMTDALGVNG